MRWRFVCEDDLESRAIAWWGNGWRGFAHVDMILSSGVLLGARSDRKAGRPPGVQMRPSNYMKGNQIRISILEMDFPIQKEKDIEKWLMDQINRKYDMEAIFDFILGKKTTQNGMWICSALGDECAIKLGVYETTGIPPPQITPDTLHAVLSSHGARERYRYDGPPI